MTRIAFKFTCILVYRDISIRFLPCYHDDSLQVAVTVRDQTLDSEELESRIIMIESVTVAAEPSACQ
jgi:hypothetical protein